MKNLLFYLLIPLISCNCLAQCTDTVYTVVEKMPSYPGGEAEMHKFLHENLTYPVIPEDKVMENFSTVVKFTVTKTGEIKDIHPAMEKYKGTILTDSLTAVVKRMPKWIPGKHNGKNVNVYYSLPLRVNLQR
ncbi:energy transducer TonB [Prevotella sp. 10(H)]|uniref:energy transducer TonB n=1 Tax=Prevotella sp. 10(H) TaxID=1158294 RepID=UPI0004A750E3|nr:energy transducer TonB [Prevotella sp. 10(H)]